MLVGWLTHDPEPQPVQPSVGVAGCERPPARWRTSHTAHQAVAVAVEHKLDRLRGVVAVGAVAPRGAPASRAMAGS